MHATFLLLVALFGYAGWEEAGWFGLAWSLGALAAFFVCVILHELGHALTARSYGIEVRRILLLPIGGMAEFAEIPREPRRELLITLAGPAVNFLLVGVLWIAVGWPPTGALFVLRDGFETSVVGFAHLLLAWNLLMGCFNLLPVFPMDGGRILRAFLASRVSYVRATLAAATVGKVFAVAGAAIAYFGYGAGLTVVLFAFIIVVGEMEYRQAKRREIDDAHWREIVLQLERRGKSQPEHPPLSS